MYCFGILSCRNRALKPVKLGEQGEVNVFLGGNLLHLRVHLLVGRILFGCCGSRDVSAFQQDRGSYGMRQPSSRLGLCMSCGGFTGAGDGFPLGFPWPLALHFIDAVRPGTLLAVVPECLFTAY
eukprot:jgi/Botrbrau1/9685/Bobra.0201s0016.1